jgi:coenzyme F420-0:L-glutamate ligase/coenzyme F420-1:gamma-L-glutamate ligase
LKQIVLSGLEGFPMVQPGDDLSDLIFHSLLKNRIELMDSDILVLAQKIVSKAEGRYRDLNNVIPGEKALELSIVTGKDPRFLELVLSESKSVVRAKTGTLIVEHRLGFICANAGIDHSNVDTELPDQQDLVLLLPSDPDKSSSRIRREIENRTGKKLGVMIIDSHGRSWRMGVVGVAIGFSGIPGLVDMRGRKDLFGFELKVTQIAAADELAASASLLMGQADESRPVIHARGFPYALRKSSMNEIIRPFDQDLFR